MPCLLTWQVVGQHVRFFFSLAKLVLSKPKYFLGTKLNKREKLRLYLVCCGLFLSSPKKTLTHSKLIIVVF